MSSLTGWCVMDHGQVSLAFPQKKTNVNNSSIRWARMDGDCFQQSPPTLTASGCSRFRRLIPCIESANKTICRKSKQEPGELTRIGWRPQGYSFPPTTLMLQQQRNARPIGLVIKSILRKRVMKTGHILLHTWSPISALFQIEMSFQKFTQLYNDKNSFRITTW